VLRLRDGDPARFRSMSGRFSRPVLPGEPLTVSIWLAGPAEDGDGEVALFQTTRKDGTVVSAGQFIPAAGQLGLVRLLDLAHLRLAACRVVTDVTRHTGTYPQ